MTWRLFPTLPALAVPFRRTPALAVTLSAALAPCVSQLVDENCEGWYAYLAKFLVLQPSQSDALLLDLALEGEVGSNDKSALIEFLCARHPRRVRATKKTWEKRNDESLVDRLSDELDGDLRTIALTMLKGKRMMASNDEEKVRARASPAAAPSRTQPSPAAPRAARDAPRRRTDRRLWMAA